MTGRERILKTFRGEKVDRVPVCPWIWKNAIYKYFDTPREKQKWREIEHLAEKTIEVADYFGFDHLHRLASPRLCYDERSSSDGRWIVEIEFKSISGRDTETTIIKTPEKKLSQVKEFVQISRYTYVEAIKEYFIKDKSDFSQFQKYQPPFEEAIYPFIIDEFNNLNIAKKALGDRGAVVGQIAGGAFNNLNKYRKLEDMMMDPYTDIGLYRSMIEHFSQRSKKMYEKLIEHGADIIEVGGNLASGGVGERFFSANVMEFEKRLADYIHGLGAYVMYHNCGDADSIMHLYNDMSIDGWGYLTPLPYGDVDLDKALEVIKKDMVLLGNIDQIDFLKKETPARIRERIGEVLGKAKKRGNFILSTTDWWTDDIPDENLKAFARAGVEYGSYE